ncbi:NAD(+) synthase [soil metagenome]
MTQTGRDPESLIDTLGRWLREHVEGAGAEGIIYGLSGGIDSAVVCGIGARALGPERCAGVVMPIGNVAEDEELGRAVGEEFGVRVMEPDLLPAFEALHEALLQDAGGAQLKPVSEAADSMAIANLKPRLRMTALYYHANRLNYLVVGTGNRAELTVGYFTKYGDAGVDLGLLGDLTKGEVRGVARALGVPARVIDRPPSAGLWEGQTDEDELGFTYDQIDRYLLDGSSGDSRVDTEIRRRYETSRHKREPPLIARA